MAIKCYHCKGNHELVSQVKDCAKVPAAFAAKVEIGKIVATVIPAKVTVASVPAHRTDPKYLALKAIQNKAGDNFLAGVAQLQQIADANPGISVEAGIAMVKIPGLDISVPAPVQTTKTGQDLELGIYQVYNEKGTLEIYKVKFNKAGTYKFAEKLSITGGYSSYDKPKGKFSYAPGMINKLTSADKMTEQQAKDFHDITKAKYGVDYGFCCVCGKLLTVKKSIDKGIGPVCETKF